MNVDTIRWGGLELSNDPVAPFVFDEIDGWESTPPARYDAQERPNAHGDFLGPVFAGGRQVIVTGLSPKNRDELLAELQDAAGLSPDGYGVDDLTVDLAGRELTARAQLVGIDVPTAWHFGAGLLQWTIEWICSDPYRYGAPVTAGTGLPVETGGLEFDLFTDGTDDTGVLEYGAAGTSGRVTLTNPGNAEARPTLHVTGTLPNGFELVETVTGSRLRYDGPVNPGQTVTLDSATGRVRLDGADRGGLLTRREWWGIPRRGQREVLFTTLGPTTPDAHLSVTSRPTYW